MNFNFMIIIVSLLVLLLMCLRLLIVDLRFWYIARRYRNTDRKISPMQKNVLKFKKELYEGSIQIIRSGKRPEFPTLTDLTITHRARRLMWQDPVSKYTLYGSECGWLFFSCVQEYSDELKKIFDNNWLNAPFIEVDGCQCGMIALLLHDIYKEEKYISYADKMYNWLTTRDTDFGILYRNSFRVVAVDVIGMAIPFLMLYSTKTSQIEAKRLAIKTVDLFLTHGVDKETGMPCYGFRYQYPHIKIGCSNWGRGVSWLVIGLTYISESELCENSRKMIDRLNATLMELYNQEHGFSQFVGQIEKKDLSAELPILYYLRSKRLITLSENDLLLYSQFMHDGVMWSSSSSHTGKLLYGVNMSPNMLSQAYMIRLLNLFID